MKKLILTAAVAVMAVLGASAQESRNFWVGGTAGFSSTDFGGGKKTGSLTIAPEVGYHFSGSWAAGMQLGFARVSAKLSGSDNLSQAFSVSPFARYTFFNWRGLGLFADGGLSFTMADGGRDDATGSYLNNKATQAALFVRPGFLVRLSGRFSLVGRTELFSAGYSHVAASGNPSADKTNTWAASLNSPVSFDNFSLGFVVIF